MKTIIITMLTLISFNILATEANFDLDVVKLNRRASTIKQGDVKTYRLGMGVNVNRVFLKIKSRRFQNSFAQLIVNNRIVRNISVYAGGYQSITVFVGEYTQSVSVRTVSGKVRVKEVHIELGESASSCDPHHGGPTVILPIHHDINMALLLEDLRVNIYNLKGFVTMNDWRELDQISILAAKAISVMNVRGDSYDKALVMVSQIIEKMDNLEDVTDELMERSQIARIVMTFNSLKEALRVLTK